MDTLNEILRNLAAWPPASLIVLLGLAAFALAAFAIYAVLSVTKERK